MTADGSRDPEPTDRPDPEESDVTDNLFPTDEDSADTTSADDSADAAATPSATSPAGPRPRIRSGAIVWGFLVSATAVLVLWAIGSPTNSAAFDAWAGSLSIGGIVLIAVISLGAFILLMALLSVVRREQRKRASRNP